MRGQGWMRFGSAAAVALLLAGGCGGLVTVPISVPLGSNSDFDVESGVPVAKTFNTTINNDSGLQIGNGSIQLDPNAISVTPDQAKLVQGELPIPETCGDACTAANVADEVCTSVCNAGAVNVFIWVGLTSDTDPMATGDAYGPFVVELNGSAEPISIDPSTVVLKDKTKQAINAGEARITIQVISPYAGTVTIESILVNAGL